MDYKRAIRTAAIIWTIAVLFFIIAGNFTILENPELQGNLTLAFVLLPLTWYGAKYYYKKAVNTPGYLLAMVMISITILLDAIITVPVLIIPMGGTYEAFFGSLGFWLIAIEYVSMVVLFDLFRNKKIQQTLKN